MPITSVANLVDILRQYQLLEPAQQDELVRTLQARFPEPRGLARELVQRGWLTPYQVNQLFQDEGENLILGHYAMLERLGEGGMGAVFKARHRRLGRVVALKLIRKDRLANHDLVRRFQREIQAAAHLDHPNVVHAYDADQDRDTHFFAMEYVEGADLTRVVKQRGPLPAATACAYVRQAALGLQHAFEHGLVHRDIKPSNLLLTAKGDVVKILDMGLARVQQPAGEESGTTLTHEGAVMGTPDYIAPEQARSARGVDIRADLYSLGCTLYFLLTGRVPFPGGTLAQKLLSHQLDEPRPVEELRPETPPAVTAVLRQLMAKRPEDRYQTPAEAAEALAAAPVLAVPVGADGSHGDTQALPGTPALAETPSLSSALGDTLHNTPSPAQAQRAAAERKLLLLIAVGGGGLLLVLFLAAAVVGWQVLRSGTGPVRANPTTPDESAEEGLQKLLARSKDRSADKHQLVEDVVAFRAHHGGTPQALRAADLLLALPSPLDRLDAAKIPTAERCAGQPKELVAVLGELRGWHGASVGFLLFSPDSGVLVSGGYDKVLHFWDPATLRPRGTLPGSLATFSSDGKTLLVDDGDVKLYDWTRWPPVVVKTIKDTPPARSLGWSAAGKWLALGSQSPRTETLTAT
jgi:serine/threonine-protein kinase